MPKGEYDTWGLCSNLGKMVASPVKLQQIHAQNTAQNTTHTTSHAHNGMLKIGCSVDVTFYSAHAAIVSTLQFSYRERELGHEWQPAAIVNRFTSYLLIHTQLQMQYLMEFTSQPAGARIYTYV